MESLIIIILVLKRNLNSRACGQSPPAELHCQANLVTYRSQKIWLWRSSHVTVLTYVRTSVRPHRLCGRGRGVPRQPDGGGKRMSSFLGGKSRGAFGQPAFFLAGNGMTIVALNGKKKFKRVLVEGEKFKLQKAAFKGLHRFVFFTAESLPCSET